jgi:hypothetical protein
VNRSPSSARRPLAIVARLALPIWFLGWTLVRIQQLGWTGVGWDLSFIGRDFWIYRNAAESLLTTGNPWVASAPWNGTEWHFAAAPTAAQLFVPFLLVPADVAFLLFSVLSVAVVLSGFWRSGVPAWWLLFPPMTEGLFAGNPQILVLGLLLVGAAGARGQPRRAGVGVPMARAAAVALKVYAIVPVVARREWRAVGALGALFAASVLLSPAAWRLYLDQFRSISARVVAESHGGLSAALFLDPKVFGSALPDSESVRMFASLGLYGLMVAMVVLVAVRDVPSAGWLAAPLLWPAAEYHLATMTIPIARRLSAWLIAVPTIPTYLVGLIVLAYELTATAPSRRSDGFLGLRSWLQLVMRREPRTVSVE